MKNKPPSNKLSIFEDAIKRLDEAGQIAGVDPEAVLRLKNPLACLQVSIPVRMDDGSLEVFSG